ncbi:UNVERIFIED_ORG: hypothetical protein J3D59_005602 [Pseudomonas fluorescens]|jgi:filamentous hemagglutinin
MATAHAEVGVIQQDYIAGKNQGAAMTLKVEGQAVCGYWKKGTDLFTFSSAFLLK